MRSFRLLRIEDETGVSGKGIVAYGVRWPDGSVSLRWVGPTPSFVNYEGIPSDLNIEREGEVHAEVVHGHHGRTKLLYDK